MPEATNRLRETLIKPPLPQSFAAQIRHGKRFNQRFSNEINGNKIIQEQPRLPPSCSWIILPNTSPRFIITSAKKMYDKIWLQNQHTATRNKHCKLLKSRHPFPPHPVQEGKSQCQGKIPENRSRTFACKGSHKVPLTYIGLGFRWHLKWAGTGRRAQQPMHRNHKNSSFAHNMVFTKSINSFPYPQESLKNCE